MIWRVPSDYFGDDWLCLSWLLQAVPGTIALSIFSSRGQNVEKMLRAMAAEFADGHRFVFEARRGDKPILLRDALAQDELAPTARRWTPNRGGVIATQFAGRSYAAEKNVGGESLWLCQSAISDLGYAWQPVGWPLRLPQIVAALCAAELFVGVDSGMAHLAVSVGVPRVVIRGRLPLAHTLRWHRRRVRAFAENGVDFVRRLKSGEYDFHLAPRALPPQRLWIGDAPIRRGRCAEEGWRLVEDLDFAWPLPFPPQSAASLHAQRCLVRMDLREARAFFRSARAALAPGAAFTVALPELPDDDDRSAWSVEILERIARETFPTARASRKNSQLTLSAF